jgi:hypothetical protein
MVVREVRMGKLENKPNQRKKELMPKNLYREKWEAMEATKADDVNRLKGRIILLEEDIKGLTIENASLKERLRLVEIAARGTDATS